MAADGSLWRMHAARGFVAVIAALHCAGVQAGEWASDARVVAVDDGATLTVVDSVRMQRRVHLAGIDTPRIGETYGAASAAHLAKLVSNKQVRLRCWYREDVEGESIAARREVCEVTDRETDVALAMIHEGLAWHHPRYAREQLESDRQRYVAEQAAAQQSRRGLWKDAATLR
jgi:endonuclease YncB( thermonuclease family)